jgi:hypothetical protein
MRPAKIIGAAPIVEFVARADDAERRERVNSSRGPTTPSAESASSKFKVVRTPRNSTPIVSRVSAISGFIPDSNVRAPMRDAAEDSSDSTAHK